MMASRALARENAPMKELAPTSREAISARLKLTRLATGMNQTEFAKKVEISLQTWNNYERDISRISLDEALKVCRGLKVGLDWIYQGDESLLPAYLLDGIRRIRKQTEQKEDEQSERRGVATEA